MALPELGTLLNKGLVNGQLVWRQPNGPGTAVVPPAPSIYPPVYEGYPQSVFAYQGLIVCGCNHWINEIEVVTMWDSVEEVQAALLCCPVCSYIQAIVEPADQWWQQWYQVYNQGLQIATLPTRNE